MSVDRAASPVPSYREGLRMQAYYFGFDFTGVEAIDRILSAVAVAGKGYHSTADWDESPYDDQDGPSYADRIQLAANAAAVAWRLRSTSDNTEQPVPEWQRCTAGAYWCETHRQRMFDCMAQYPPTSDNTDGPRPSSAVGNDITDWMPARSSDERPVASPLTTDNTDCPT